MLILKLFLASFAVPPWIFNLGLFDMPEIIKFYRILFVIAAWIVARNYLNRYVGHLDKTPSLNAGLFEGLLLIFTALVFLSIFRIDSHLISETLRKYFLDAFVMPLTLFLLIKQLSVRLEDLDELTFVAQLLCVVICPMLVYEVMTGTAIFQDGYSFDFIKQGIGPFTDPNSGGIVLNYFFVLSLYRMHKSTKGRRAWDFFATMVIILDIIFCFSRQAIFICIICYLIMRRRRWVTCACLGLALFFFLFKDDLIRQFVHNPVVAYRIMDHENYYGRLYIYLESLEKIWQQPLLGYGYYIGTDSPYNRGLFINPHNNLLGIALTLGLGGLAVYGAIWIYVGKRILELKRMTESIPESRMLGDLFVCIFLIGIGSGATHMLFHYYQNNIVQYILWGIIIYHGSNLIRDTAPDSEVPEYSHDAQAGSIDALPLGLWSRR